MGGLRRNIGNLICNTREPHPLNHFSIFIYNFLREL